MKKLKFSALIILTALITAASMSGCGIFNLFRQQPPTEPTTAATAAPTTEAQTTVVPTTAAPATDAPTAAPETQAQQSSPKAEAKMLNGAVLCDGEEYYDSYFGIKFSIPEWKGKVYAKGELTNGSYSLTFYEKSNYEWGIVKEWDGMGMLFTVYTSPKEVDGQNVEYPAGSVEINGSVKYLTYFKPTDVRCNTDDENMANDYQRMYKLQRQYFMSGVVDADKKYKPSSNPNAVNLKQN